MDFPAYVANDTTFVSALYYHRPTLATPYMVVLGIASVVGTLGNLLIIGTLSRSVKFRNPKQVGNMFIINLASSDLVVTAVINPVAVIGVIIGPELFEGGNREWLCTFLASLCVTSCVVSLLSVGCISVNRYVFICHHQRYASLFTKRNCILIVAFIWLFGLALDLPSHVGWSAHTFDRKTQKCLWDRTVSHGYTVFFVSVGMLLPLTIITIFYWRIFAHIRKAKQRVLQMKKTSVGAAGSGSISATQAAIIKTIRQVKMIFVIFVAFSLCWTPYIIVLLSDVWDVFPLSVHLYASMIAHLHASVNFILYGLANKSLRAGYRDFLTRRLCFASCCAQLPLKHGEGKSHADMTTGDAETPFHSSVNGRCKENRFATNGGIRQVAVFHDPSNPSSTLSPEVRPAISPGASSEPAMSDEILHTEIIGQTALSAEYENDSNGDHFEMILSTNFDLGEPLLTTDGDGIGHDLNEHVYGVDIADSKTW